MSEKISVTFSNGRTVEYEKGVTLLEISRDAAHRYTTPVVAAKVNNTIRDLQNVLEQDSVVDFLDLRSEAGMKVYQRSVTFVLIAAAQELFPGSEVTVEHSLSKGLYCELHHGRDIMPEDVEKLEQHMRQIIEEDRPIVRKTLPKAEAIEMFKAAGQREKVSLLEQFDKENVNIYYCGQVYDYLYGNMTPSTGYVKVFELKYYPPGIILRLPEKDNPNVLPKFVENPKLFKVFKEAAQWGNILRCAYVANLNECTGKEDITDIIRVAEALHEKKIAQIADFVASHRDEVRVILVAGPSSSGKTTFAQRLNIQLRVNGVWPVPLSLDDYFVDREKTPVDEHGEYDFESIEAIDLELFNSHLARILSGEEVEMPTFNFKTGQREYRGHRIKVDKSQPLIIEGIHGLNERLTSSVPRHCKIKIYISALTQLSIDSHNRIPTTDARLIRRIVRDSEFRSHDALMTLKMWPSVRRGEERNIFPFQEEADLMFNSALIYELAVLKKYAEPLLQKITPDNSEYSEARRLLNFLEYFIPVEDNEIPQNSILREFIGKSCFEK
ncbi:MULTISPECIES: nucleoside kinase [Sporomusa]|uniref:Threonine--tRNA ligase 1 n=1 Tax=Sporomusa sphaeroides DSM 2875 TaxID=1337886 RepID=A0ABP2CAN2_9FIRM|nr:MULTISPECIES: nucleoside kinase [Sporomusa]MCM0759171.1 nucleoside kinase [Sporomusa sphaeroides DSM 2875]OLS58786.1 threonine--tRNA ligase 1 [Sporomusa sphaeroides DSM 2875]CVK21357.1 Threonine--tRNA ligase 1 [Sporomusa sphaeroides DSM 2875]HML35253.1 nucleoside kinase [Sporomusa sphaeroides]